MGKGKKYKTPLRHQNKRIKKRGWSYGEYNCRVGGKDKFTFKHIRRGKFFKRLGDVFHLSMTKLWERERVVGMGHLSMKSSKVMLILAWVILFVLLLNTSYDLINKASNIANIVGVVLLVVTVLVSIKTKCLTSIKSNKQK